MYAVKKLNKKTIRSRFLAILLKLNERTIRSIFKAISLKLLAYFFVNLSHQSPFNHQNIVTCLTQKKIIKYIYIFKK
jgi:hypothetical protein